MITRWISLIELPDDMPARTTLATRFLVCCWTFVIMLPITCSARSVVGSHTMSARSRREVAVKASRRASSMISRLNCSSNNSRSSSSIRIASICSREMSRATTDFRPPSVWPIRLEYRRA